MLILHVTESGSDTAIITIAVPSGVGAVLLVCCVLMFIGVVIFWCAGVKPGSRQQRETNGSQACQMSTSDDLKPSATNPITATTDPTLADVAIDSPKEAIEMAGFPRPSATSIPPRYTPNSSLKVTSFQSAEPTTITLSLEHINDHDPSLAPDTVAPASTAPELRSDNTNSPPLATTTKEHESQVSGSSAAAPPRESPPNYDQVYLYHTVPQ